jgi:hypothetical protein
MPENIFKGWIIRIFIIVCGITITLFSYFMNRMITTYDKRFDELSIKIETLTMNQFELQKSMIGISGRQDLTNEKVTQLGILEAAHYLEIQKIENKVYKIQ